MATTYDWSPLFDAINKSTNDWSQRSQYNAMLNGLIGKQVPGQVTPGTSGQAPQQTTIDATAQNIPGAPDPVQRSVNATIPGMAATQATQGAPTYDGMAGQALGGSAAAMLPMLRNMPPQIAMPLLLNLATKNAERKQGIEDARVTPLSDDEAKLALGAAWKPDGKYGKDISGNIVTIQKGETLSAPAVAQQIKTHQMEQLLTPEVLEQKKELEKLQQGPQWAALREKEREFNASNPMLAGGGGAGPSTDLKSYPPAVQGTVRSMLDGRMAPPTSFAMSKPYWQNMMALANALDPTFDQTSWQARAKVAKDYSGGGTVGKVLGSGSTAINHLSHLNDQISGTSGIPLPLVGGLVNQGINAVTNPYTGNVSAYKDTLGHVAEETTKFYRNSGGAEADIVRNMENMAPDLSTIAKRKAVDNTVSLIFGKLQPTVEQYNSTMGTKYPPSHFLSQKAVSNLKRMGYDPDTGEKVSSGGNASGPSPQDIADELRKRGVIK